MYPTRDEHYLLVEENLFEADADCGCAIRIEEEGLVRFFQCSLHAATPDLLEALAHAVEYLPVATPEHTAARALIRRAKGEV